MTNYLRPHQIEDFKSEIANMESQLQNPAIQNKSVIRQQLNRMKHNLETQTPPDLNADQRDQASKRLKELEQVIKEGMPSAEEMRKAPPGAIGKHQEWEKRKKAAVLEYKRLKLALHKGSADPDLASVEHLRPKSSTLSMAGSLIEGKIMSFPSEAYKENYDEAFRKESAEVAKLRAELEELKAFIQSSTEKKQATNKKRRETLKEQWAAKMERGSEAAEKEVRT